MASTGRTVVTLKDRLGNSASVSVHETLLTAGNFSSQATLRAAFVAALNNLSDGLMVKEEVIALETKFTGSLPVDPDDLKAIKFLCRATDTNGNAVTIQIPVAQLELAPGVNKNVDLTGGAGLAFKTAWDAYVLSNDGEATVLNEVVYIDK
jgi:hypothetical protein